MYLPPSPAVRAPCPASSCFVFSYLHIIVKTQLFVKGTRCTQGAIVLKSGQSAPCAARFAKKGEYLLMKVLLINGSPHEKGCTYTALSLIAGELNASGIETEILNVGTKPVGGCIGCGGCAAGKGCVFGGVVNEAIEKAKTADAFVFGTPVHYASASGNMTSFMDRLAYAGGKYLAYKPAAICASARRAGTTTTLDQLVKYPEFFHMPLVSGSYWPMVHGSKPEQVLEDEEGCAVMRELGRNMAWLLKCIELGKANGITHPENPRRPMTNFIR